MEQLLYLVNLLHCPQIPGIDGIKGHALALPVGRDGFNLVGEVFTGEVLKHGVGGQDCRR